MQQIVREPESIIAFLSRIIRDAVRILTFGSAAEEELTTKEREPVTQEELDRRDYDNLVLARRLIEQNREIVDLREENAVLKRVALVDPLTGLYNRHGGEMELERTLTPYKRLGHRHALSELRLTDVTVVVYDVDDFKQINDTYGHDAGDRSLAVIAEHLRTAYRANDIIIRWGGDEIVVIVVGAPQDAVFKRARQFQVALASDTALNTGWKVTCSAGIAHGKFKTERGARQLIELLRTSADNALLKAKHQLGKNWIVTDDTICVLEDYW